MPSLIHKLLALSLISMAATAWPSVIYSGFDAGAEQLGANGLLARDQFLAATGGAVQIDFESPLPDGVQITTLGLAGDGGIREADAFCPSLFCGGNFTPGGTFFFKLHPFFINVLTLTFSSPIEYFGASFGGVQFPNLISFDAGSGVEEVWIPSQADFAAGSAFAGFTSFGSAFTSVTISVPDFIFSDGSSSADIISVDDIIFGPLAQSVAVPEPRALLMVGWGLIMMALLRQRRRR
ncbi:MAG: PEP-CTERM sorting domain-containing protein [Gammaproteobacteria bacterium]|nr:PEP-CTERM sorting domain-containing protein [Gammaproteobacteria bacterium]